ncbi:MAG: hypothetical protein ACP5NI_02675 [Acetobacteraceae bacterium]
MNRIAQLGRLGRRLVLPLAVLAAGIGLSGCAVYPAYPAYAGPAYYGPYVYPNVAVRGVFVWHGR